MNGLWRNLLRRESLSDRLPPPIKQGYHIVDNDGISEVIYVNVDSKGRSRVSSRKPLYKNEVATYSGAHRRVVAAHGKASEHLCAECGTKQASDWAYDGKDPDERVEPYPKTGNAIRYSLKYNKHYVALCRSCHRRRDAREASAELNEYRQLKHATGLKFEQLLAAGKARGNKAKVSK